MVRLNYFFFAPVWRAHSKYDPKLLKFDSACTFDKATGNLIHVATDVLATVACGFSWLFRVNDLLHWGNLPNMRDKTASDYVQIVPFSQQQKP